MFNNIIVSTDDDDIAKISQENGAEIPFIRSDKNSDDNATTADVVNEVLEYYKERYLF